MAGGAAKFRHLSRKSSHRQALLRNLVTSLIKHESITTTWPKAKEAQRLAERLITLGKKNTEQSRRSAISIFFVCFLFITLMRFGSFLFAWYLQNQTPHQLIPKLFGPLRERYANRPGGYTRVLRVEPKKDDQAPSAILELVDGPKDMKFAMTARTLARKQARGIVGRTELDDWNYKKATQFRQDGEQLLKDQIAKLTLEEKKNRAEEEETRIEARVATKGENSEKSDQ